MAPETQHLKAECTGTKHGFMDLWYGKVMIPSGYVKIAIENGQL